MPSRLLLHVLCGLILFIHVKSVYPLPAQLLDRAKDATGTGDLFEGDILVELGEEPYGSMRQTLSRIRRDDIMTSSGQEAEIMEADPGYTHTWPNNTVYYTFAQTLSLSYRQTFTEAMELWSEHTCIQFRLAASESQDHILFVNSDELGCSSYVGRKGGSQVVSMNDHCFSKGQAIHEIGHAIGLWHEHSRPDRDEYIEVLYENIKETEQDSFGKLSQENFDLVPDVGYDIESIMHFGPFAFVKEDVGNRRSIRLRDDAPLDYKHCANLLPMGQRDELSYLDKLRANRLYSCTAHIVQLEGAGRVCSTPAPPPITTPAPMCPHPPSSPPATSSPWPQSQRHRLRSGSVITLHLEHTGRGVKCAPNCLTRKCYSFGNCNAIDHQFEIVVLDDPGARKIRSGAKVALRSRGNPTQWLDCSGPDNECSISRCTRDACYITSCDSHHFRIYGVGRRDGRLLNSNHRVYFRHGEREDDSFLSCYNSKCRLSSDEDLHTEDNTREAQIFSFTILH